MEQPRRKRPSYKFNASGLYYKLLSIVTEGSEDAQGNRTGNGEDSLHDESEVRTSKRESKRTKETRKRNFGISQKEA
jgi:hypothetical protein